MKMWIIKEIKKLGIQDRELLGRLIPTLILLKYEFCPAFWRTNYRMRAMVAGELLGKMMCLADIAQDSINIIPANDEIISDVVKWIILCGKSEAVEIFLFSKSLIYMKIHKDREVYEATL